VAFFVEAEFLKAVSPSGGKYENENTLITRFKGVPSNDDGDENKCS